MKEKVKIGYIGLGRRGSSVMETSIRYMDDVEVVAICDTYLPAMEKGKNLLLEMGKPEPIMTTDYKEILAMEEIDAVFIMIGWSGRVEMAIESMKAGKYTAIEVGCAYNIGQCYDLIRTHEETGVPVMMLENSCYSRKDMLTLNLVKSGILGEIVHCDGGYHHYLPGVDLFTDLEDEYKHYRLTDYINRNCEQYPTHDLGPISKLLNINRGNRMLTLSSFASKSRGLKEYAKTHIGEDSEYAKIDYKQGDIITTIITCANGETIHLCLDTTLPRAFYSRNLNVRGTKGMFTEDTGILYLEGMEESKESNLDETYEKYEHPLHKEYQSLGTQGGHGGNDYLVARAFIESVKRGTNTPIDPYDTAMLLAIAPLSEASIAQGGAPVSVPDFTNGKWMNREPVVKGKYCLNEICIDDSYSIY